VEQIAAATKYRYLGGVDWEPSHILQARQRHFLARRHDAIDGVMEFDLRTLPGSTRPAGMKPFPAWMDAFWAVLSRRREANFEVAVIARFPHHPKGVSRSSKLVGALVGSAAAMGPLLDLLMPE
jgi:hypothetical protein